MATLGPGLAHLHLHDNDGMYDQHLPVGQGIEDWSALFSAITTHAPEAIVVLESDTLSRNEASLLAANRFIDLDGTA